MEGMGSLSSASAILVPALRIVVGCDSYTGLDHRLPPRFPGREIRWPGTERSVTLLASLEEVGWLHLGCESTWWLRRFAGAALTRCLVRRVTIVVEAWRRPGSYWSGRVGPLPGLVRHEVRLPTSDRGQALTDLTLADPAPLKLVLTAALGAMAPYRRMPMVLTPEIVADEPLLPLLNPQAGADWHLPAASGDGNVRPREVRATPTVPSPRRPPDNTPSPSADQPVARQSQHSGSAVFIDPAVVNPIGRHRVSGRTRGRLYLRRNDGALRWFLSPEDSPQPSLDAPLDRRPLSDDELLAIRSLDVIEYDGQGADPEAEAGLLAQIAATGTIVHVSSFPGAVRRFLSRELAANISQELPGELSELTEWDSRSVRQRRSALRSHAFPLAPVTTGTRHVPRLPGVSALLVTMRKGWVAGAIRSIASQTYPELEIILGLHGFEAAPELRSLCRQLSREISIIEIPGEANLGEALGIVTLRSCGDLLTKIDDDDIYGPEHIWDLVIARAFSSASITGKGSEFVYLEQLGTTVRRTMDCEAYSTVVAGGTIMISRGDLGEVGGWSPWRRSVDRGLLDRVRRDGGLIYRTHPFGFVHRRHADGHTWEPGTEYFLRKAGPQWEGLPPFAELAPLATVVV